MESLELTILNYLRERDFYDKVSPFLDDSFFTDKAQMVYETIKELIKNCDKGQKILCKDIFLAITSDQIKGEKDLEDYRKYMRKIRISKVSEREVLFGICKEFLEKNLWKDSLEKFMPFLTKRGLPPVSEIEGALEQTRRIRSSLSEGTQGYDYFENTQRAQIRDSPGRIESPLKGIYLYPGEVGIWVGPPKRGKTYALINTGYKILLQGKRLVHFTLEIPADWVALRYDARILKRPIGEIKPEDSLKAIKKIKLFGGNLIIQDRPELSLSDIKEYLRSNKTDAVIVDYPDLMTPPRKSKERRFELVYLYQGLRSIAKEFKIPVWGASQAGAKGFSKELITMEHLEESKIGKGGTCSLILTINQSYEEKEDGVARIYIAACSRGIWGKPIRKIETDFETMTMKEVESKSRSEKKDKGDDDSTENRKKANKVKDNVIKKLKDEIPDTKNEED